MVGVTVPYVPAELVTSNVLIAKEAVTEMFLLAPKSVLGFIVEPSLHETKLYPVAGTAVTAKPFASYITVCGVIPEMLPLGPAV